MSFQNKVHGCKQSCMLVYGIYLPLVYSPQWWVWGIYLWYERCGYSCPEGQWWRWWKMLQGETQGANFLCGDWDYLMLHKAARGYFCQAQPKFKLSLKAELALFSVNLAHILCNHLPHILCTHLPHILCNHLQHILCKHPPGQVVELLEMSRNCFLTL